MENVDQASSGDKLVTVYLPDNQVLRGLLCSYRGDAGKFVEATLKTPLSSRVR